MFARTKSKRLSGLLLRPSAQAAHLLHFTDADSRRHSSGSRKSASQMCFLCLLMFACDSDFVRRTAEKRHADGRHLKEAWIGFNVFTWISAKGGQAHRLHRSAALCACRLFTASSPLRCCLRCCWRPPRLTRARLRG